MSTKERYTSDVEYGQIRRGSKVDIEVNSRRARMRRASDPNIYMPTISDFTHKKRHRRKIRRYVDIDDLPLPSDLSSSDEDGLSLPPKPLHKDSSLLKYNSKTRVSQPYDIVRNNFETRHQATEYYHSPFPTREKDYCCSTPNDGESYTYYYNSLPDAYIGKEDGRNQVDFSSSLPNASDNPTSKFDISPKDCPGSYDQPSAFVPYRAASRRFSLGDVTPKGRNPNSFVEYEETFPLSNISSMNIDAKRNRMYATSNKLDEINSTDDLAWTHMEESLPYETKVKYHGRRRHSLDINQLKMSKSKMLCGMVQENTTLPQFSYGVSTNRKIDGKEICPKIIVTDTDPQDQDDSQNIGHKYKQINTRRRSLPRIPNDDIDIKVKQDIGTPRRLSVSKDSRYDSSNLIKSFDQYHKLTSNTDNSSRKPLVAPVPIHAVEKVQILPSQAVYAINNAAGIAMKDQLQIPFARHVHEHDQGSPLSINCNTESGYSTVDDEPESPRTPIVHEIAPFRRHSAGEVNELQYNIMDSKEERNTQVPDKMQNKHDIIKNKDFYGQPLDITVGNLRGQESLLKVENRGSPLIPCLPKDKSKIEQCDQRNAVSNFVHLPSMHDIRKHNIVERPSPSDRLTVQGSKIENKTDYIADKLSACSITILPSTNISPSSTCCNSDYNLEKRRPLRDLQPEGMQSCKGACKVARSSECTSLECSYDERTDGASLNSEQNIVQKDSKIGNQTVDHKVFEGLEDPTLEVLTEVAKQILEKKKTETTNKEMEELKQVVHNLQAEMDNKDKIIKDLKAVVRLMKNLDGTFQ